MRTTRRSALVLGLGGGALLGGGLSGCDSVTPREGSGSSPDAAAPPEADPDRTLLDGVLVELDGLLAAVVAARSAFPRLQDPLAGLEQMHLAHRAVLDPDPGSATTTPSSPAAADPGGRARAAARRVVAGETAHEQALAAASLTARSGALARLLASMSASVTQHLAVLPTDLAGPA